MSPFKPKDHTFFQTFANRIAPVLESLHAVEAHQALEALAGANVHLACGNTQAHTLLEGDSMLLEGDSMSLSPSPEASDSPKKTTLLDRESWTPIFEDSDAEEGCSRRQSGHGVDEVAKPRVWTMKELREQKNATQLMGGGSSSRLETGLVFPAPNENDEAVAAIKPDAARTDTCGGEKAFSPELIKAMASGLNLLRTSLECDILTAYVVDVWDPFALQCCGFSHTSQCLNVLPRKHLERVDAASARGGCIGYACFTGEPHICVKPSVSPHYRKRQDAPIDIIPPWETSNDGYRLKPFSPSSLVSIPIVVKVGPDQDEEKMMIGVLQAVRWQDGIKANVPLSQDDLSQCESLIYRVAQHMKLTLQSQHYFQV